MLKHRVTRFLRWSERFTKTDMVYLTSRAIWPLLGQIAASGVALILAAAFSRLLTKEAYGTYKFILSIPALFGILLLPGLTTSLTRSIAKGMDGDFAIVLSSKIKWATLFWLVGYVVSAYYLINGNFLIAAGILIVVTGTALGDVFGLHGTALAGRAMLKESTWLYLLERLLTLCLLLVVLYWTQNILLVLASTLVVGVIIKFFGFIIVKRSYLRNNHSEGGVLAYGKHLSFMGVFSSVVSNLDNLLAFHFLGAPALAIYAYATAIPDQLKGPILGMETIIFAKFAKHKEEDVKSNIGRKLMMSFLMFASIVIVYWIVAPYIFSFLFPQYTDAVMYSRLFSISLLASAFFPASTLLSAHRKIKEQYISGILNALFQLGTMLWFITQWGLLGLIVSRVVSRFFGASLLLFWTYRSK